MVQYPFKLRYAFRQEVLAAIARLSELGVSRTITDILTYRADGIVDLLCRLYTRHELTTEAHVVPTIPTQFMSLKQQLQHLGIKRVVGCTLADIQAHAQDVGDITHHKPYFMLNVKSGLDLAGLPLDQAGSTENMLTLIEVCALIRHAPKLMHQGVWAGRMRMIEDPESMGMYLKLERPHTLRIEWKEIDEGVEGVGVPTCVTRH